MNTSNDSDASNINALVSQYVEQIAVAKITLMSIALGLSLVGVFIITATVFKIKRLLNFTNVLVLNLCWSSLLLAIGGLINAMSENTPNFQQWIYGEFACRFLKSWIFIISVVIAYSLVAISYARFRIICQPLHPPPERHYAYVVIAITWIAGIAVAAPYFASLTIRTIGNLEFCTFSGFNGTPVILDKFQRRAYLVALTTIIFIIPFLLQAGLNITIAIKMNSSSQALFIDPKDDKIASVKRKLTIMSISLVVLFFITWLPYFIIVLLQAFDNIEFIKFNGSLVDYYRNARDFLLIRDSLLGLIYCSSIFNVTILYIFNPHFKASLKRVLGFKRPSKRARVESEITITERSMSVVSSMMAGKIDMKY